MALIYCTECGKQISDSAPTCPHCGVPVAKPVSSQAVCPETHLTKAIIVTILCCWPFGIPAIVNAAGVSNAFIAGNYELAAQRSKDAAKWCKVSIIAAVVFWILYAVLIVLLITAGYYDM